MDNPAENSANPRSFYDLPQVQVETLPVAGGIPLGIERVINQEVGIGGAFGTWGESFDNESLLKTIELRKGEPVPAAELMNLSELGFHHRQHIPDLQPEEHQELEELVGAKFLLEAAQACGWEPGEVQAVVVGMTGPTGPDSIERMARRAGIPESALKVSVHKACDGSVGGLNLVLNPDLSYNHRSQTNIAEALLGKKVLVGGIEGLSRFLSKSRDWNALQLFGNGAGIIGLVPGKSMKFIAGKSREVYDDEGVLEVHMYYPHSRRKAADQSLVEVTQAGENHIRVAGLMHEPENGASVAMAGMMGMVKLFVRSGVQIVQEVYQDYLKRIAEMGMPDKSIAVAIAHHANLKINQLKLKHLQREGIYIPTPWLLEEFGNVSAASNMMAFLRKLSQLRQGQHVLFDGFGAGTYYDVLAVELGST